MAVTLFKSGPLPLVQKVIRHIHNNPIHVQYEHLKSNKITSTYTDTLVNYNVAQVQHGPANATTFLEVWQR